MYEPHYAFKLPENPDKVRIWKYMDLWKFLNLLETSALFLCRVDKLGDQYEGRVPERVKNGIIKSYEDKGDFQAAEGFRKRFRFEDKELRHKHLVSCWVQSEYESFAMWKLYSKDRLGVAIQTNIQRLIDCFRNTERTVYIGQVNYYNDSKPEYELDNSFFNFISKYNFYKYEEELRVLIEISDNEFPENEFPDTGIRVQIDLTTLLENIYLAPFASKESEKLVHLLKKEYNLSFNINKSQVSDTWM